MFRILVSSNPSKVKVSDLAIFDVNAASFGTRTLVARSLELPPFILTEFTD
jgi:hypothetical protein